MKSGRTYTRIRFRLMFWRLNSKAEKSPLLEKMTRNTDITNWMAKTRALSLGALASFSRLKWTAAGMALLLATALLSSQPANSAGAGDYHFERAMRYEFAGNVDAAIAEYRRGLEQSPDSVDGHTRLGTLLLDEQGDVDGAISEFVTGLTLDPSCSGCQSRLDEAVARRNASVREGINRGNDFYRAGQLTRSAAAYRIAIAADPNDGEARNCLAWTLYRMGRLEDALAEVKEALRLKPEETEYVNTLACVQFDLGNIDGAMANFKKAILKAKTPNPADYYGLALTFLAKGDQDSSVKNFKQAIKSDPNYTNSSYLRDKIGMSVHTLALHEKLVSISGNLEELIKENQAEKDAAVGASGSKDDFENDPKEGADKGGKNSKNTSKNASQKKSAPKKSGDASKDLVKDGDNDGAKSGKGGAAGAKKTTPKIKANSAGKSSDKKGAKK